MKLEKNKPTGSLSIAIVVLVYNEEERILSCLQSIVNQTTEFNQLIIINNNSTDNSDSIIKDFINRYQDKNIIYENEAKQGIIPARNHGFALANCDILAKVDADTRLGRTWIAEILKAFEEQRVVGVSTMPKFRDMEIPILRGIYRLGQLIYIYLNFLIFGSFVLYGTSMAIRASYWPVILPKLQKNDLACHEDIDISIYLKQYGKIKYLRNISAKTSVRRFVNPRTSLHYLKKYWLTIKVSRQA